VSDKRKSLGDMCERLRDLGNRLLRSTQARWGGGLYRIATTGFHGDSYLIELTDLALKDASHFIETGTNVGSTLRHVARRHPHVYCLSCEPDSKAFSCAEKNTADLANVTIFNMTSQAFLGELDPALLDGNPVFWLDAHGYGFEPPLREEVRFVTSRFKRGRMLIDDCEVPGLPVFGYNRYRDRACNLDYISGDLDPAHDYRITYPSYKDRTSRHHPLRGWILIEFGYAEPLSCPDLLEAKTHRAYEAFALNR